MLLAVCFLPLQARHLSRKLKEQMIRNIEEKRRKKGEISARKMHRIINIIKSTYDKVVFLVHLILQGSSSRQTEKLRETNRLF